MSMTTEPISPTLKATVRELLAMRDSALADIAGAGPVRPGQAEWLADRVSDIAFANNKIGKYAAYMGLRPADFIAQCS
jgi:hypothetical protein